MNGGSHPLRTLSLRGGNGSKCPRLCKNAQEPTMRRIVFSIAHFLIAATALFLFRLTKSRKTFYVQVECLCFHTAWPQSGHSGLAPPLPEAPARAGGGRPDMTASRPTAPSWRKT